MRKPQSATSHYWLQLPEAIVFHSRAAQYSEFSNFHSAEFEEGSKRFQTVEAFFQHAKFAEDDAEYAERIRKAATPGSAKALGRKKRLAATQVAAWQARKVDVMRRALHLKFTQNAELKALLLETGEKLLVERPLRADKFWAAGAKGDGRNMLGVLLMELRASLAMADTAPDAKTSSDALLQSGFRQS